MKQLVPMAIRHAREKGYAFMVLGGQRQRYGYFGFDTAGCAMRYAFNSSNARHAVEDGAEGIRLLPAGGDDEKYAYALFERQPVRCLREERSFSDVCRTWGGRFRIVWDGDRRIGYYAEGGREIVLEDDRELPRVLKAILREDGKSRIEVDCPMWDGERRSILYGVCESSEIVPCEMMLVLDWERTLRVMLALKAGLMRLPDFRVRVGIGDEAYSLSSENGRTEVVRCGDADIRLTQNEAHRLFFALESAQRDTLIPPGWLPLPFWMSAADGF